MLRVNKRVESVGNCDIISMKVGDQTVYKLCKTEQSAIRQRQLELGLMDAMANRHYDEISVSDLCERLQIPRKSFYRYFSGKDGALHALIDHTLLEFEWISVDRRGKEEQVRQWLERFFRFWLQRKTLLDVLQRSGLSGVLIERSINQAMQEAGIGGQSSDRWELAQQQNAAMFAVCGLMSVMLQWHHSGYNVPPDRMGEIAVSILTQPLWKEP